MTRHLKTVVAGLASVGLSGCLLGQGALDDLKPPGADDSAEVSVDGLTIQSVELTPAELFANQSVNATVTVVDGDGASVDPSTLAEQLTFEWHVRQREGGEDRVVQSGPQAPLAVEGAFVRGDAVYVVAAVGESALASDELVVSNTPPTAPVIRIDPPEPDIGENLVCQISVAGVDADGDGLTTEISWYRNEREFAEPTQTNIANDTIDGSVTAVDDEWQCVASHSDGFDNGDMGEASTTVGVASCNTGDVVLTSNGVDFVEICSGSFDMGCTPAQTGCQADEEPVMPVTLSRNYLMSRTEITKAQYQGLMGTDPSACTSCVPDTPVEMVTWHMAAAFANAMSETEGLATCYSCTGVGEGVQCELVPDGLTCDGYRLPTEAEWEGAARCREDLRYAGSDSVDVVGWYNGNSSSTPHSVGELAANACGLYDMSGNVFEWVEGWYAPDFYEAGGMTDPIGPVSGDTRGFRGGSWNVNASVLRVSDRDYGGGPTGRDSDIGIRLVRSKPQAAGIDACADGFIDGGIDWWGREDIVYCDFGGPNTMTPAEAQAYCGSGWQVCSAEQFVARNDLIPDDAPDFQAVIDDGDDCQVVQVGEAGSGHKARFDDVRQLVPGTCSGPRVAEGPWGRQERTPTWGSLSGVVCCRD